DVGRCLTGRRRHGPCRRSRRGAVRRQPVRHARAAPQPGGDPPRRRAGAAARPVCEEDGVNFTCMCGATIEADDMPSLGDTFIAHVRTAHTDWPYSDSAVRNFAEATQRLTGSTERVETIGAVTVQPVTADVMDDWLQLFDHDGFADNPAWAACYCTEPHLAPAEAGDVDDASWQQRRTQMIDLLGTGRSYGYLAYVDGRPAGWVNASKRS